MAKLSGIQIKRIYDPPEPEDGRRVLVDRLWPRGVRKADAELDDWLKEAAPSDGLRRWFGHEPERWEQFQRRYFAELDGRGEGWQELAEAARRERVTLLYAARDPEHNHALALRRYLEGKGVRG